MKKMTMVAIGAATAVPTYAVAASGSMGSASVWAGRDIERHATCHGAKIELSVEKERKGFDVDAGIDRSRPFSVWSLTLRHDGKVIAHRAHHRTDDEGEMDVDRYRPDTSGADVFKLTVKPKGKKACALTVRTS